MDFPDEGDLKCTNVALVFSFSSCLMSSSGECLANEEDRNALTKMILELKGHEVPLDHQTRFWNCGTYPLEEKICQVKKSLSMHMCK